VKLKGLDLILTYECTSRCAHCCYRAGPGRDHTMTLAEVESYLAGVANQPIEWVLLFGGEPFIPYELLRASVAMAARRAAVLVFTNGSWATDPGTARLLLGRLQEAGLDQILFSVDAFHQEHVSLERIAVGVEAARSLGYGTIEIDNRFLGEPNIDNAFNRRTQDLVGQLAELCDLADVRLYRGSSRMVGRAADELSSYVVTQTGPFEECAVPEWLGDDILEPTTIEIHPGGWVNLCAGLALGNARQRPLDEILANYNPDGHPIIRVLTREGPPGASNHNGEGGNVQESASCCRHIFPGWPLLQHDADGVAAFRPQPGCADEHLGHAGKPGRV
jgi:organic radical activating enzyme